MRLGLFGNMLSRTYATETDGEHVTYTKDNKSKCVLRDIELTGIQKAELEKCYVDMMKFVKKYYR